MQLRYLHSVINDFAKEAHDLPGLWREFGYLLVVESGESLGPDKIDDFLAGVQEAINDLTSIPEE